MAQVPAIITQDQFDLVQAKLAQNQQYARRNNTAHPYAVACTGELWELSSRVYRPLSQDEGCGICLLYLSREGPSSGFLP